MVREKILQYFSLSSTIYLMCIIKAGQMSIMATGVDLKVKSLTRLPLNDVLFTEDVLLGVSARSRIDCSKTCVETEGCVMCTFLSSPQGPPGHCRLHSQLQTLSNNWKNATGAKSLAPKQGCDSGYVIRCGRCLRVEAEEVTYTVARQRCLQRNQGQLMMPKTPADVECLHLLIKEKGLKYVWVGADDTNKPREFRWNDGTLLADNDPVWDHQAGDPEKENPGSDCAYLYPAVTRLHDNSCQLPSSYVCQKDAL